ncbi:Serine/threonine protein kinase, partial [Globisporangium splendens]
MWRENGAIYASRNGNLEITKMLIDYQASPSLSSIGEKTPLLVAGSRGHYEIFKLLIEKNTSVHVQTPGGEALLTIAASRDDFGVIARLADEAFSALHASSDLKNSLLPTTLGVLRESGNQVHEFGVMWDGAVNRLCDAYDELVHEVTSAQRFREYVMIVVRFIKLKTKCQSKSVFTHLVAFRMILSSIEDFHVATLQNALVARGDQWSPDLRNLLKEALDTLSTFGGSAAYINFPRWFLSPDELELDGMEVGKLIGDKVSWDGKWLDSRVTIYQVPTPTQDFIGDAEKWLPMSHPNVVRMFGAMHLEGTVRKGTSRHPHRAVLEDVSSTNLRYYLAKQPYLVWQKLHEAALGIKYVHERKTVLGSLSCANIWIGTNGVAKIVGFGASSNEAGGKKHVRWAAPECLKGGPPTFKSDLFSFGMCIMEALTGAIPWGTKEVNDDVKRKMVNGHKPDYPAGLNDSDDKESIELRV